MYLRRKVYKRLLEWKAESSMTLEVTGARQVGKTYIIKKFAEETFRKAIYINMLADSGNEFLECIKKARQWEPGQERPQKPLHQALAFYDKEFTDTEDTVVIIDEIQESAVVYNLIREFTRDFHARFIVTGSYLGRVLNKEFKLSAGDLTSIRIETLTFEEFMVAIGKEDLYQRLDMYGKSDVQTMRKRRRLTKFIVRLAGIRQL